MPKMVNYEENDLIVREFEKTRPILVKCIQCSRSFGYLSDFKRPGRKIISIEKHLLDWDVEIKYHEDQVSCPCGQKIGYKINTILFLQNQYLKFIY